jgi:hypothetical protein
MFKFLLLTLTVFLTSCLQDGGGSGGQTTPLNDLVIAIECPVSPQCPFDGVTAYVGLYDKSQNQSCSGQLAFVNDLTADFSQAFLESRTVTLQAAAGGALKTGSVSFDLSNLSSFDSVGACVYIDNDSNGLVNSSSDVYGYNEDPTSKSSSCFSQDPSVTSCVSDNFLSF